MQFSNFLSNQFLIAMPGMADPNFNSTVTLICEHNADGALGIVINRPMDMPLGTLVDQLPLRETDGDSARPQEIDPHIAARPILDGGPVSPERGFVLHMPHGDWESSLEISGQLALSLSLDVIDAISQGEGPESSLIALGYAGWDAGQLEAEMLHNAWLNVPASTDVIFDVPFADRWTAAAESAGIDLSRLSSDIGHA